MVLQEIQDQPFTEPDLISLTASLEVGQFAKIASELNVAVLKIGATQLRHLNV